VNGYSILKEITAQNDCFVSHHKPDYFLTHIKAQAPLITAVTCCDSRVQPQVIFEDAINKIFLIENIGNQIMANEGSVDYGIYHLKTPLLLILGHCDCGAIKAFVRGDETERLSIKAELTRLKPALADYKPTGDAASALIGYINQNVHFQVNLALEKYKPLVSDEKLLIVGAFYDFSNELKCGHGKISILQINNEIK